MYFICIVTVSVFCDFSFVKANILPMYLQDHELAASWSDIYIHLSWELSEGSRECTESFAFVAIYESSCLMSVNRNF